MASRLPPRALHWASRPQGTLNLEFKSNARLSSFELHFQDDGSRLDPDQVRATAIARGLVTEEEAARLRDRQAIKLIFKSGYSTMGQMPGELPRTAPGCRWCGATCTSRRQNRPRESVRPRNAIQDHVAAGGRHRRADR
jgi:hypothetical protein